MEARTIMIYADSGVGKSTEAYKLVRWLLLKWKNEGRKKKVRVFNTDGGGSLSFYEDSGLVKAGYVEGIDISSSDILHLESKVIADGRWPLNSQYRGKDTDWHEFDHDYMEQNIGAYVVEGFDSLCNRWASHMGTKGEKAGFKLPAVYIEEALQGQLLGEMFITSGLDQGHYGMIQRELEGWWNKQLRRLPVEYIICTSLVQKGKDKLKRACYGPSSIGTAQVGAIPQWFNDCWFMERMQFQTETGGIVGKRVAWFEPHIDSDTECEYAAKFRTIPDDLEDREKHFPEGFIILDPTKHGIVDMYKWRENRLKEKKK